MQWVTTTNIEAEAWRRILEFANLDLAIEIIEAHHGIASKLEKANYQKQAKQIRVCLLQAKEFFIAAKNSSLFTSPNHLYYGMMSLASAIMLIRGTGIQSLDILRKDTANKHHGLLFSTGITASQAAQEFKILDNSRVEILNYGHFKNWYNLLPEGEDVYGLIVERDEDNQTTNTKIGDIGIQEYKKYKDIVNHRPTLLELLQFIPDLSSDLNRFGALKGAFSRITYSINKNLNTEKHQWTIHGIIGAAGLDTFTDRFRVPAEKFDHIQITTDSKNTACIISLEYNPNESELQFEYPLIRRSSDLSELMYDGDAVLSEIAEIYLFIYGLSMLSRYYPDYWISCIESHGKSAKMIERAVEIMLVKFPILVLNSILPNPITISSHRPPWF